MLRNRFAIALLVTLLAGDWAWAVKPSIMQPQVYQKGMEVCGWLMSEKLDGVRGYWDGKKLLSKNGIAFRPPPEFIENFPGFALEGEIWGGRQTFEKTVAAVKSYDDPQGWLGLKFAVFDAPEIPGGFVARLQKARSWFLAHPTQYAFVIDQVEVKNNQHLDENLKRIEALGGEGLILRNPDSHYEKGRSRHVLKVKSYEDNEAKVIAILPGTGRNSGRMGSLLVELPDSSMRFKIGSGFSDAVRRKPPPVGALITFKYYGLYKSGIPKFPTFLRIRVDQNL